MSVEEITTPESFSTALRTPNKLIVVDFTAKWCGPCHTIAPLYAQLATKYIGRARFLKIDVDEAQTIARQCAVTAMPTFHLYLSGRRVADFSGADPRRLQDEIERHAPAAADVAFASAGRSLGGEADARPADLAARRAAAAEAAAARMGAARAAEEANTPSVAADGAVEPTEAATAVEPDAEMLQRLVSEMGFPTSRASQSLIATENRSLEAAIEWCFEHTDDPSENPAAASVKPTLSPAEARAKAEALSVRARAKRQADERAEAAQREKERVRSGKEVAAARVQAEEEARRRAVEEKRREKREAIAERQRVREMLEADRQSRRERFRMPAAAAGVGGGGGRGEEVAKGKGRVEVPPGAGKIQFRLPDGSRIEGQFEPDQTMGDLIFFLQGARPELAGNSLAFSQMYPRKVFSQKDHDSTLGELQLLPQGALTVSIS